MKLTRLIGRRPFSPSPAIRNVSGLAKTWIATSKPDFLSQEQERDSSATLNRKIWPVNPESVITPFLDQLENEGHYATKHILVHKAKRLRNCGRFRHALQVLQWIGTKRSMDLSAGEIAIQLDLISKLYGWEEAESFFSNLPKELKTHQTYGALLNCYVHETLVDKAEALVREMRGLGLSKTYLSFSAMLTLYHKLGDTAKVRRLEQEMVRLGVMPDEVMYGVLLSAYGSGSDVDGMDMVIEKAESDPRVNMGSPFYCNAASLYLKAGLVDKGVGCLRKAENLLASESNRGLRLRLCYLLTLYAEAGMKEDVLRVWNKCKFHKKYSINCYVSVMSAFVKLNEFEAAEKILDEYWESTDLGSFDMRIPNLLIGGYCRNGLVKKAENVIARKIVAKGLQPESFAWYYLAQAHIAKNRMPEAVEAMKSAALAGTLTWKPSLESLVECFRCLVVEKDMVSFKELAGLLKGKGFAGKQVRDALQEEFGVRVAESGDEKNTCDCE